MPKQAGTAHATINDYDSEVILRNANDEYVACWTRRLGKVGRWRMTLLAARDAIADELGLPVEYLYGLTDGLELAEEFARWKARQAEKEWRRTFIRKFDSKDRHAKAAILRCTKPHPSTRMMVPVRNSIPAWVPDCLLAAPGLHRFDRFPACVYFLCKEKQVVYVGQSTDLPSRLSCHEKDKSFDEVFYIECDESALLAVERRYIEALNPPLNTAQTDRPRKRHIAAPAPRGIEVTQ